METSGKPSRYCVDPVDAGSTLSLWISDGTVVLQAESTVFRVYAGILGRESTEFGTLFAAAQPANQEMHDECPLIRLSDSALDVYYFLKALHEHRSFFASEDSRRFSAISAVLCLSTKYIVPHLRAQMIATLEEYYPRTLFQFDSRKLWPVNPSVDMEALNLVRETHVLSLLPVIMYDDVGELGLEAILDGIDSGSKKVSIADPADVCSAVSGARKLAGQYTYMMLSLVQTTNSDVEDAVCPPCTSVVDNTHQRLLYWLQEVFSTGFPPTPLASVQSIPGNGWASFVEIVGDSFAAAKTDTHKEYRARVLAALPQTFGLHPWDSPESAQDDAPPHKTTPPSTPPSLRF